MGDYTSDDTSGVGNTVDDRFALAWREHRAYLTDLAFRMLGDIGEAQDVVQEAFVRLGRELDRVDDARGWLTVVTSRLCLDQVRSARWRREHPDPGVPDTVAPLSGHPAVDPADRITLDDDVRAALLVMLERLGPAERVAFVLHDVFTVPFEDVAQALGKPVASCRQLAHRARVKIAAGPRPHQVAGPEHRAVTESFIRACTNGDVDGLLAVLAPQAWGRAEFASPGVAAQVNHGALAVARNLVQFWGPGATMVGNPNGGPSVLAFLGRDLAAVIDLDMHRNRIRSVRVRLLLPGAAPS